MQIISKVHTVTSKFGAYEIKLVRIRGLKLRELVRVRARKQSKK